MFTDPKNLEKVGSLIILTILVFSKMATVIHLEFDPVKFLTTLEILPKLKAINIKERKIQNFCSKREVPRSNIQMATKKLAKTENW